MKLIVISGLSGAGKTVALKQYEDLGYNCIDNIPLALLGPMTTRMLAKGADDAGRYARVAIGVDARESAREIRRFPQHLAQLKKRGVEVHLIFLTASDEVLLRRYSETRRPHPLADGNSSLSEAIERERALLAPIADLVDDPLDTTQMNLHELREAILQRMPEAVKGKLVLQFMSFGFKNGVPGGCDYLFDVRCLPNPHWNLALRDLTGRDEAVEKWLDAREDVQRMLRGIGDFLEPWLGAFRRQDRAYVTIGVGCTGGQHRSVYLVERLAKHFAKTFEPVIVKHKELR